jgi:PAS domain S-box-containing protein
MSITPAAPIPHEVQFYESEHFLRVRAGDFLADGVAAGEAVVLVCTPEHRDDFAEQMRLRGADPSGVIFAEARETLDLIMVDGAPDPRRFHAVAGGLLDRAGTRPTRVYGEMVDLLCREGNTGAAMQLEELWNDLARRRPFYLLCAYEMSNFRTDGDRESFAEVCRSHGRVMPAESFSPQAPTDVRERQIAALQQRAAALEHEVAQRREAERALRRSEAHLRDFVENAAVAIHWVGPDGTILYANDAELRLLGYPREEYIGHNIAEFHADQRVLNAILRRLGNGEIITDCEAQLRAKDGSIRWVAISSNVMFDDERFVHTRCFTRDITQRKVLEAEQQRLLDLAHEANRAKDDFLATLSHELRTPLTAILGWARMLRSGVLDVQTASLAVDTIERSARAQASLIDDILDLSKIVTGKLALQMETVDLVTVVGNAIETVRLAAGAREIRIEFRHAAGPVFVTGDPTRLQQIAWNLLSNAVKFSEAGSVVAIEVTREDDSAKLVVRDQGTGIRREFLPHVFEPFRQAEQSATRAVGGLGLGLAIVKHFTEAHGGTIVAESEGEGRGATFTFAVPLAPETRTSARNSTSTAADLTGRRILVVDDDDDTRTFITAALRTYGGEVDAVQSVAAALDALKTSEPDIVVTDIAMPERDGFDLLRDMQLHFAHVPAIALTGFGGSSDERRILDAGFRAFIAKPVDPLEFAQTVERVTRA